MLKKVIDWSFSCISRSISSFQDYKGETVYFNYVYCKYKKRKTCLLFGVFPIEESVFVTD